MALAAFTGLISGIEPDLSSYPHEVLGVWAREGAGAATKLVADVRLEADFGGGTVAGAVSRFPHLDGAELHDLSVTLGETGIAGDGVPFAGNTTAGSG